MNVIGKFGVFLVRPITMCKRVFEGTLANLQRFLERLEIDPFHAGESAYRLPGLRMQVRTPIVPPIVVDFAVCEDQPLVFIKGVKLLSAQGS